MLEVTNDELTKSLTQRAIAARGDVMMKSHDISQAEFGKDALAKAIYDRLFTWIIQRINKAILVPGTNTQKRLHKVIGVLDIYGFEIFDSNSFEQFCINYCNEKLQQLFIGEYADSFGCAWASTQFSFNLQNWC
jgi:myosin I